jgi:hypothetical protein
LLVVVAEQQGKNLANQTNILEQPMIAREEVTKQRQDLRTFVNYFA